MPGTVAVKFICVRPMALMPVPPESAPLPGGLPELMAQVRTPLYPALAVLLALPYRAINVVLLPAGIVTAVGEEFVIATGSTMTVKGTGAGGHPSAVGGQTT
jgi:hypothetical protein